jgi:bacterioferritin (cytochrome b1)
MTEPTDSDRAGPYHYEDHRFASEREMLVYLLDEYRCVENFAHQYLSAWRAVSKDPRIVGGLRTICGREGMHAAVLEQRLRELGGEPVHQMPADRLPDVAFYGAPENSDAAKMARTARRLEDPHLMDGLREVIAQIEDDRDTRELLTTIIDDETASIRWILDSWAAMEAAGESGGTDAADD